MRPIASFLQNRFLSALGGESQRVPPIWLMRQAGRYHRPYQQMRQRYSFEELCRQPELAAQVTMAPVADFDFDAAILFSDLLFPLEALGFGLSYADGPPKLDGVLDETRVAGFRPLADALSRLTFQREAMKAVRERLPAHKGLIGFVGGPWTLFVYAVEGSHAGPLARAKASGALYRAFADRIVPLLIENIRLQFEGGADVVMVLDTAAGELEAEMFASWTLPDLARMAATFPQVLGYYAKGMQPAIGRWFLGGQRDADGTSGWHGELPFAGTGLDWHWDMAAALSGASRRGFVQGNFDPNLLAADESTFRAALTRFLEPLAALDPHARRGWICGVGHGVVPQTPEANVRAFVQTVRETLA